MQRRTRWRPVDTAAKVENPLGVQAMCFAAGVQAICLKERGLAGVELVVSDDHAGLKKAIREVLPGAALSRALLA